MEVGGVKIYGSFTNGSGVNDDSIERLIELAESFAGFITTKTSTYKARAGNPGPRFFVFDDFTINSMGLPNPGYEKMSEYIVELKKKTHKPVFGSISPFTPEEAEEMGKVMGKVADVVEVNLSCPNVQGKSLILNDLELSRNIVREVKKHAKVVAVKAAPFTDPYAQEEFAEMIKNSGVKILISVNTLGNAMYIDKERKKIMLKVKWGGLGGKPLKWLGIGNVRRYYEYFKGSVDIVGCGGIYSGSDAYEYALAGAKAFAVASALAKKGTVIFEHLEKELKEELKKGGFEKLEEAVGKAEEF